MATQAPTPVRTTNPNNEPRLNSTQGVARTQGLSYNRGNTSGKQRKDSRQQRS